MTCVGSIARECSGLVRHYVRVLFLASGPRVERVFLCEACVAATPVEVSLRPCTDGCGLRVAA